MMTDTLNYMTEIYFGGHTNRCTLILNDGFHNI